MVVVDEVLVGSGRSAKKQKDSDQSILSGQKMTRQKHLGVDWLVCTASSNGTNPSRECWMEEDKRGRGRRTCTSTSAVVERPPEGARLVDMPRPKQCLLVNIWR